MLTEEQKTIVNSNSKQILVNACAGSGKTTTLYNFAMSRVDQKILYLAFNRSMKEEAQEKFKSLGNTEVRTIHSLAYRNVGYQYKDKLTFKYKAYQLAMDLGYDFNNSLDITLISEVRRLFNDFLRSKAESIEEFLSGLNIDPDYSKKEIFKLLNEIFELKKDTTNNIQITHNFYLKLFHLSKPNLSKYYDLILLDEAQDINEVIIDIFQSQDIPKVAVGDSNQQVYAWNGAVDALNKLEGDNYFLTNSFRIGSNLANICNLILKDFGKSNMTIKGKNESQTIGEVDKKKPYAKLCRTRAMVFDNAVANIATNKKIYFEGGVYSYNFDTFTEAWFFSQGKKSKDPLLAPFDDYEQLLQYVENTEDLELEFLTKIVDKYEGKIPNYVKTIKKLAISDKKEADIIISTLHRAKGLEYQQLILENDFINLKVAKKLLNEEYLTLKDIEEELNIIYVALTRAMGVLELNKRVKNYITGEESTDINTLSAEELRKIRGVGKALSERIIKYRNKKGSFKELEDLKEIPGVGKAVIKKIEKLL